MSNCSCGHEKHTGRINGQTLKQHLKNQTGHPFGKIDRKKWINVCAVCHVGWLKMDEQHSLPFVDSGGLMRTAANEPNSDDGEVLDFVGFRFTLAALRSAIALQALEFRTREVEEYGAHLPAVLSVGQASDFSKLVCYWGGGGRVWGKLRAGNGGDPGAAIAPWLNAVKSGALDDEEAISVGCAIAGLGVSFASKHLRMLQPYRFAVLDEVLRDGFGFALNRKGFAFFLRELRALQAFVQKRVGLDAKLATLEAGLFMLVRQTVRARAELA